MILATANLNNRRTPAQQHGQLVEVASRADVIAVQEATSRLVKQSGWAGKQFDRWIEHPSGEAVLVGPHVTIRRTGGRLANQASPGGISRRFYPWADIPIAGVGAVRVICAHRAPRRSGFQLSIWPLADWRLRRVCRRANSRGIHWAVLADFNDRLRNDPAKLQARLHGVPYGNRIDGAVVSPSLARYVRKVEVVPNGRADNHDVVYLTVALSKEKP